METLLYFALFGLFVLLGWHVSYQWHLSKRSKARQLHYHLTGDMIYDPWTETDYDPMTGKVDPDRTKKYNVAKLQAAGDYDAAQRLACFPDEPS